MSVLNWTKNNSLAGRLLRFLISLYPYNKWKLGDTFFQFTSLLQKNEGLSFNEIRNYQFKELVRVVNQAYNNTIFYKEKYDKAGFQPSQVKTLDDLKLIPILTREEIRDNCREMLDNTFSGKLYKSVTSGSTAKPITIYRDRKTAQKEWAAICYQWARVGYQPGEGRIEFRGILDRDTPYLFLSHERVLRINVIEMDEDNIDEILKAFEKTGYNYIQGYPSSIYKFCGLVKKKYGQIPATINIESFFLASENIFDWQIELMREVIPNAKVICHYGLAEKIALGAWFNDERYHFIPTYSLVEITERSIIGTSFINDVMPLIRYEVSDKLELESNKPVLDKTLYPVVSNIIGRIEDITYTTKGKAVSPAIVNFPFHNMTLIEAARVIQLSKIEFDVIIQSSKNRAELQIEINELEEKMKVIYGENAVINFSITNEIPLTKNGKFKWVECKYQKDN